MQPNGMHRELVWVFTETYSTFMRKGFDGLAAAVQERMAQDPFCGHLFVFRGRRGNRAHRGLLAKAPVPKEAGRIARDRNEEEECAALADVAPTRGV
jgi:hypothetical protein